jgi:thiamine pyrophosphate-dependent acetolactate synthase large subunit-like protein
MTKLSIFVSDVNFVRIALEAAVHHATSERPGPVWVDIPIDIQQAEMPDNPVPYHINNPNIQQTPSLGTSLTRRLSGTT